MSVKYNIFSKYLPTQSPSDLTYIFNPSLDINEPMEVGLIGGHIVASNPNVSVGLGNNTLRYSNDNGVTWFNITLPDGIYAVSDLNTEIHKVMKTNTHINVDETYDINLSINLYLLRVVIEVKTTFRIDLTLSKLNELIGFNSAVYSVGNYTATSNAKIGDLLQNYFIQCDIIEGGLILGDNLKSNIIKVVNGTSLGAVISLKEMDTNYLDYFPVTSKKIQRVNIKVLDIENRIVDFKGEHSSFVLHFRRIKE